MSNFAMPAREFMQAPVHGIQADASLQQGYDQLRTLGISGLAVTDADGKLVGTLTRSDLLKVGRRQAGSRTGALLLTLPDQTVSSAMSKDLITATPDDTVSAVGAVMLKHHIHRVFLVEDGHAVGVLSTRDVMRAIRLVRVGVPLSKFMSSPAFTVRAKEPISLAADRLPKAHVSGLVVVEDLWPVGVFTQEQALASRDLPTTTPVEEVMSPAILLLAVDTPLYRAAEQASAVDVRRVVVLQNGRLTGIVTGLDFVRATV